MQENPLFVWMDVVNTTTRPAATLLTEISSEVPDEGSSQPPEISETTWTFFYNKRGNIDDCKLATFWLILGTSGK